MNERESWVRLCFPGAYIVQTETGQRETHMAPERLANIAQNTNAYLAKCKAEARPGTTPFTFPILIEHEPSGIRLGGISELRYGELDESGPALWARARWTAIAWEAIKAESIERVSLGTDPNFVDEHGRAWGELLCEFSVVSHPLMRGVGSVQDTLTLRASATTKRVERFNASPTQEKQPMTEDQIKALIASFATMLQEALAPLMVATQTMQEAATDTSATPDAALEEAIAELEGEPNADAVAANAEEELEEKLSALEEEKEQMSARIKRLEGAFTKLIKRQKGLNFSERGAQGKSGAARPTAGLSGDAKVEALKARGLSGEALWKAYYGG